MAVEEVHVLCKEFDAQQAGGHQQPFCKMIKKDLYCPFTDALHTQQNNAEIFGNKAALKRRGSSKPGPKRRRAKRSSTKHLRPNSAKTHNEE